MVQLHYIASKFIYVLLDADGDSDQEDKDSPASSSPERQVVRQPEDRQRQSTGIAKIVAFCRQYGDKLPKKMKQKCVALVETSLMDDIVLAF